MKLQTSMSFLWGSKDLQKEATSSAEGSLEPSAVENRIMPSVL